MKKIGKDQQKELDRLAGEIPVAMQDLNEAIEAFNLKVAMARDDISESLGKYNDLIDSADTLREDVSQSITDYMGDKSEKWQEGTQAERYDTWRDEWDGVEFLRIGIDEPEPIEPQEDEITEILSNLPTELT
jgi:hypothetical protein